MPSVIKAIVGVVAIVVGAFFAFAPLIGLGASLVLSSASSLLTKKPNFSAVSHDSLTRSVTVRQPISPRKIIYGSVGRVGGVITFIHVEGATGQFLHLVITLAGHQVNAINTMYFDGVAVPITSGAAMGNYAGFVTVEYNLGTATQTAFPNLVSSSSGKWTSAHQQKGRAGVHIRLKWDAGKFPNGVPNITFDIDGALVYDPRSNVRAFSNNAALCLADYLTNTDYGLGAATQKATRIQTSGGSNVNVAFYRPITTAIALQAYEFLVYVENIGVKDAQVRWSTVAGYQGSVTVPAGTKANVYLTAIWPAATHIDLDFNNTVVGDSLDLLAFNPILRRVGVDENLIPLPDFSGFAANSGSTVTLTLNQIASVEVDRAAIITAANICDEAVTLNAGGTEARYTTNGVIDTSVVPADAISSLLTAMAGYVVYTNAVFKIYAGAYISPVAVDDDISEGDLRGDITIQTTRPKRDLFNGVKGLFVSPTNGWQPTDFPPKQNATYLARDRGESIWKDIELPFTTSVPTAQRLAKIALERNSRQISVTLPLKLSKYTIVPPGTIRVSNTRLGWVNKTFEVASVNLVFDDKGQQGYIIGVDVVARETDSSVFSWTPAIDELASTAALTVVQPDNSTLSNMDYGIVDGSSRYARTAGNSSYRPLSNPLTGHDAGASVTIDVAGFTMRYSDVDVSISAGSVGSLAYSTGYFIYYDDATRAGGAVTFGATTTKETALNGAGRMFVGSIRTPAAGAPDTVGNNDGGVGAQFGGLATSVPVTFVNPAIGGDTPYATPEAAIDSSYSTSGAVIMSNTAIGTADCDWKGFTNPVAGTPGALTLKITSQLTNSGIGANIQKLSYSLNGGSSFTDIYNLTNSARAKQTDAVTLAANQDISQIVVRAQLAHTGGVGSTRQDIYDIRLEILI